MSLFRVDPERIKTLQGRIADIRTSLETHPVPSPPADAVFSSPAILSALGEFREAARQRLEDSRLYCQETEQALSSLASGSSADDQVAASALNAHSFDKFQRGRGQDTGRV